MMLLFVFFVDFSYAVGRICSVREVAEMAFFLASGKCDFIVGASLELSGGAGFVSRSAL